MTSGRSSGRGRRRTAVRGGGRRAAILRRMLAVDDRYASHMLGGGGRVRHVGGLELGGQLAFPLVAAVLKPDLDLRLAQSQ